MSDLEIPSFKVCEVLSTSEEISREFDATYPKLLKIIHKNFWVDVIPDVYEFTQNLLETHIATRKRTSGEAMVHFYRNIKPERTLEEDRVSYILGWCIEIIQAANQVEDEMTLDLNELENPTPSKSLDPPTPPLTTNEKRVLENIAHRILLLELGDNPGFIDLLTTVYAIGYKSLIAKCFEMKTEKSLDILKFRMDIYNVSAAFKSAHFILFAPLAGAISLAGFTDPLAYANLREMATHIAIMYQIQEDMMNFCGIKVCHGDDIQNGKCTWLIIKAMSLADENQLLSLQELYGTRHGDAAVREIYANLRIPTFFVRSIEEEFKLALKCISNLPQGIPGLGLRILATAIFKRMCANAVDQALLKPKRSIFPTSDSE